MPQRILHQNTIWGVALEKLKHILYSYLYKHKVAVFFMFTIFSCSTERRNSLSRTKHKHECNNTASCLRNSALFCIISSSSSAFGPSCSVWVPRETIFLFCDFFGDCKALLSTPLSFATNLTDSFEYCGSRCF